MENYVKKYLDETSKISQQIDHQSIENIVSSLIEIRERDGRVFFIGSGGGAGHASHAVNDFRKIANIESYTPTDNVSELTARINDDGWDTSYLNYLKASRFNKNDGVFVFSVGGGNKKNNISINLVECMQYAVDIQAKVMGIVGKDGGFCKEVSENCVVIPVVDEDSITPHTEGWQAIIWHLIVSHPKIIMNAMKWESTK